MKKFIFSLFFAFIVFATASAQKESEHLTFKGVPIDGTLNEYVVQMKQVGFTHIDTQDGIAILRGDFAGVKDCKIIVSATKTVNKVNTIEVIFPEQDDWASLKNDYVALKSMLKKKYGRPSDCIERFQGGYYPTTDNSKFEMLRCGYCTWYTTYSTSKGDIHLSIENRIDGCVRDCYILLRYSDKINTDAVRAQAMDDL